MNEKFRDTFYDNLKFFLIVTVVVGHFVSPLTDSSKFCKSLFLFIYTFHMPLFVANQTL